ncbi:MAG TPA: PEP-CTERM sorting domain-containing protein [Tepidisphaeraceae bacterium]|nr:PEP-CTERM sorting domain-containing protein [Tepidisphaeraceae bacterium]
MQRMQHLGACLLMAVLLAVSTPTRASLVRPISRTSSITADSFESPLSGPAVVVHNSDSTADLGLFDSTVIADSVATQAHQRSSILANGVDVLLEAKVAGPHSSLGYKEAKCKFEFVFDIIGAASYQLVGNFAIVDEAPPAFRQPFGQFTLKGPGVDTTFLAKEDMTLNYAGDLSPGTYTLSMTAFAKEAWACSAIVSGTLIVVPEPASLSILGIGCALLVRRVR